MTKYADEQIIEYLRTLREGDVLTAVKDLPEEYTKGWRYYVSEDGGGDLRLIDDNGLFNYVRIGGSFDCSDAVLFRDGIFEIPTQTNAEPFEISITQTYPTDVFDDKSYYIVHATADGTGLERLQALSAEGKRTSELARLIAQRDEIQRKIDDLEVSK